MSSLGSALEVLERAASSPPIALTDRSSPPFLAIHSDFSLVLPVFIIGFFFFFLPRKPKRKKKAGFFFFLHALPPLPVDLK